MKIFKLFLVIFLISSFNHLQASNDDVKSKITKNLRCLVCQGQSVYDSDSQFAISMKVLIDKKLEEGFTEIQIYDFFRERYGEWILYDPELNKNTYILWILPMLIFLIGGAIIFKNFNFKK
ncbi:cytochrome c-type biogenesis protein CcmH [Candidatus Pelagibacter sp.]|nr:cytochrome c-type biogenesis protein CcmH [Candidatus Pelagibacter sp.]